MPAKLEEIEATYLGERYRFGDCMIGVGEIDGEQLTIKGDADDGELIGGQTYRFYGRFANYKNRRTGESERQFHFVTFVGTCRHDRDGIISYLSHAGKGLGLGKATAKKLWEVFGPNAVKTVRERPNELCRVGRITEEKAAAIADVLKSQQRTEATTIELTGLLTGRGLPKATPRNAIKEWGNRAAQVIRRDPYRLMAFRGCGFKLCDSLWIELGLSPHRLRRQALAAWYTVASDSNGHTWIPAQAVADGVRSSIGGTNAQPVRAVKLATRLGKRSPDHCGALAAIRSDGDAGPIVDNGSSLWFAEGAKAAAEDQLAGCLVDALAEGGGESIIWPAAADIPGISDHQREKFAAALSTVVGILGGSPGTGKTFAIAMLVKFLLAEGIVGIDDIAIGCPTGKAAVRITESLEAAGVSIRARTWHSLLGVGVDGFLHGRGNPWPFRVLVGDESSMNDTALMRSIFAARPRGCHVLMVGDVNQLPPVGSGAPLRDMITSGLCGYGELTEIRRNTGGIVETCAAIRDGRRWEAGDNLKVITAANPTSQIEAALQIINRHRGKLDPVWDCQILVAVNARSPISRREINRHLQTALNPNPAIAGTPFRLADKIVCLENGKYTAIEADEDDETDGDAGQVYVANGELAEVIEVEEKSIIAKLSSPHRIVRIPRGKSDDGGGDESSTGCSWDLAYGLSVHKSQGSDWPVAIVMIDEYPGARRVCDRSWIYTAISRAKSSCYLVGRKATADAMCKRQAIAGRKTFLRELMQLKTAERSMETL